MLLNIFLIALGLSADAFAVALSLGLSMPGSKFKNAVVIGLYFGFFQGIMPLIGYFAAVRFAGPIEAYGQWIAFAVLVIIGVKMIYGSLKSNEDNTANVTSLKFSKIIPLALATSIDALVVGVSFAFLDVAIFPAATLIAITAFILSAIGVKIGNVAGIKLQARANFIGGLILVLLGFIMLF